MPSRTCWWSTTAPSGAGDLPQPAAAAGAARFQPKIVEGLQPLAITWILAAVQQMGDALRIDPQGRHLIPEPLGHRPMGQLELGAGQLACQEQHQLLLLAGREAQRGRRFAAATALPRGPRIAW